MRQSFALLCLMLAPLGAQEPELRWPERSLHPVARPALPMLRNTAWPRDELDRFVLAALEARGISPSAEADRIAWLRRVSLDLIGLPPTPGQCDAFVADRGADAHLRQVERLLSSPHFGERWAMSWLDLARYADTKGYEKDARREMWRYRDWVIAAFQQDLPLPQFTVEQLAGDLLAEPTLDQRIATAFHRNTMTNDEGGTDDEEFRSAAVVDRVNTTLQVWMGATAGCAQCHDHKYDPISQREYFQLYAFFDQTEDADRPDEAPVIRAPTAAQVQRRAAVEQALLALRPALQPDRSAVAGWADAVAGRQAALAEAAVELTPWETSGPYPGGSFADAFGRAFPPEPGGVGELLAWQPRPEWRDGAVHQWRGDHAARYLRRILRATAPVTAVLALGSDDGIAVWWNGAPVLSRQVSRAAAPDQEHVPVDLRAGDNELLVKITNGTGPSGFWFELRASDLPAPARAAAAVAAPARDDGQWQALADAWVARAPELQPVREAVAALERELADLQGPTLPVLRELPPDRRRTTHVHQRGDFRNPGEEVQPATPGCFHPFPADQPRNRLGLARWLTSRDNPRTARVLVNRVWQELFGRGLVATGEDFGRQGDPPSHPDLLDYLAFEYMEAGWRLRPLLRRIVLSATYRQAATVTPELLQQDPSNQWLARSPRFRLPAETLRDQALSVAGLLSPGIGGPSVMPPQPDGVWQQIYSGDRWTESVGADRHRRGLYTFWRRTSPHPAMTAFDAPSREFCVVRRSRTNTPLQALVTWNDPQFFECAQALGAAAADREGDDADRVRWLFRRCLLRDPTQHEQDRLLALLQGELRDLVRRPADAVRLAGLAEAGTAAESDPVPLARRAAWTLCASVLLNLDEFVCRP